MSAHGSRPNQSPKRSFIELLEQRVLFSAAGAVDIGGLVHAAERQGWARTSYRAIRLKSGPPAVVKPSVSPATAPFSPSQIRHAYGIDSITFQNATLTGDGSGQTVAIIDAFDDPKMVSSSLSGYSTSDLYKFNAQFGLPQFGTAGGPTFTKVSQSGGTSYPQYNSGWATEIALDVEWVHAIAPRANIVLVEARSASYTNLLINAVGWTRTQANITVVSMSFGGNEFSGETTYDSKFTTPAGHSGMTFIASTGDGGSPGSYPAYSPNVLAVGGTTLSMDTSSNYTGETGWSGSGGGVSTQESRPAYQTGVAGMSGSTRNNPDISFVADPNSGVYVLDTSQSGGGGWYQVGGTSLSAPCWAGLVAIANQGRIANGLGTLNGRNDLLPALYTLPAADFHDVVGGSNGGFTAVAGYDQVTGIGSPIANLLVPDLAGGKITGTVFQDNNGNGAIDTGETMPATVTVFLDANNNGVLDAGEFSTTTSGSFSFTGLAPGTYHVREVLPAGYVATTPARDVTLAVGQTASGNDLGNFPVTYSAGAGDVYYVKLSAGSEEIWKDLSPAAQPSPTYQIPTTTLGTGGFTFNSAGGATLTLDFANGDAIPAGGISFAGTGTGNTLSVSNLQAADAATATASSFTLGGRTVGLSGVQNISIGGAGTTTFTTDVAGMSLAITGGSLIFDATQNLGGLSVSAGALAQLAQSAGTQYVLTVPNAALSIDPAGRIDLTNNSMIVTGLPDGSDHQAVTDRMRSLLQAGYNGGAWSGDGIASSTIALHPGTALGYLDNGTQVTIRYTWSGDAGLDQAVNFNDLLALAQHYGTTAGATWAMGDFNYDGDVDFNDLLALAQRYGATPAGL